MIHCQQATRKEVNVVPGNADAANIISSEASCHDRHANNLSDLYHDFDDTLNVLPAPSDGSLKSLVTFENTRTEPIHRWYTFKEGYSFKLLTWLQQEQIIHDRVALRLLDPYMGVSTTILAAQLNPFHQNAIAVGVERNPAIRAIAHAKLQWHHYSTDQIQSLIDRLESDVGRGERLFPLPGLSTLSAVSKEGKQAFDPETLQDLLHYRQWVYDNCEATPEREFFLLAWTAVIGDASSTRKDGRALRFLPATRKPSVKGLLLAQAHRMLFDICALQTRRNTVNRTQVLGGDARRLPFADGSFNAICYSPPYLNNIDYTEVYKLELWLRGDVTDTAAFRALRLGTLRSHPSVQFPETDICSRFGRKSWIQRLRRYLLASVPNDKYSAMRRSLFSGYIDDMLLTLAEQARVAEPGSPIVCVVGNSLHGGEEKVLVCTDLLIAAAAQAVGLRVERLQIARQLPRRDHQNGWLRETIIVMQKPRSRRRL